VDGRVTRSVRPLTIAQINTTDEGGGAATVASGLMRGHTARGHRVWHIVGRKRGGDSRVLVLPDDDRAGYRASGYLALQSTLRRMAARFPDRGFGLLSRAVRLATHPRARADRRRGIEDFEFPGTHGLLDRLPDEPDIVHAHNLHGGFFDLRALAPISARVPTVVTLHDMWLLTGHCAHALGCSRWQTGCGRCPDLALDPAVRRDATDRNWLRKQAVFAGSRLHLVAPSRWLGDKVADSMLAPFAMDVRVIPNGVDRAIFQVGDKQQARSRLGLPDGVFIVLLTTGGKGSMWKDDRTLHKAIDRIIAAGLPRSVLFVAVGRKSAIPRNGHAATLSIPFQHDPAAMAQYYQAADLYLHAARADTFPTSILEAMACGTPVVATSVGGIPEQVRSTSVAAVRSGSGAHGGATGLLVPAGGAEEMAAAAAALLSMAAVRLQLGANAARDVIARFTLDRQVDAYLAFYRELLDVRSNSGRTRTPVDDPVWLEA
jgi:glycosyltransferase involved in cell wall biosynthesis